MADQISNIIAPNELSSIELVINKLGQLEEKISEIGAKSIQVKVDLTGAESLTDLNTAIKEQSAAVQELTKLQKENKATMTDLKAVQASYGDSARENVEILVQQKLALKNVEAALKNATDAYREGGQSSDVLANSINNLTEKQQVLKVEISATTLAMKSQIKENIAATGSIDEMSQSLYQLKRQYMSLSESERENAQVGGVMLTEITALDTKIKQLSATIGDNQRNVGNYASGFKTVAAELTATKAKMTELIVAGEKQSAEYIKLEARAIELAAAQRQVTAETGMQVFSMESLGNRFETMGSKMLMHMAIAIIVIQGAQMLYEWFTKDAEAANKLEESMKTLDVQGNQQAITEQANAQLLLSIAQDTNEKMSIRLRAVDDLQSKYPDYLGNLSNEAFLTGQTADAMERLNSALLNKALAEAALNKVAEQAKAYFELNDERDKQAKKAIEANKLFLSLDGSSTNQYAANAKYRAAQDEENAKNEIKNIEKKMEAIKQNMAKYQKEANDFAALAGPLFVSGKDKGKDDRKANFEKELKEIAENRKLKDQIAERDYAQSQHSYNDEYALLVAKIENEKDAWTKEAALIEKAHKEGIISNAEYLLKYKEYNEQYESVLTKSAETYHKVQDEIRKERERETKDNEDYVTKLEQTAKKIDEIGKDLQDKQVKYQIAMSRPMPSQTTARERRKYDREHKYDSENFAISEGEGKVRIDNLEQQRLQDRLDAANRSIHMTEIIPRNDRSEEQRQQLIKDIEEKDRILKEASDHAIKLKADEATEKGLIQDRELKKNQDKYEIEKTQQEKIKELKIQLAEETFKAIVSIQDNQFAHEQQQLEIKRNQLEINNQQEIERINASTGYQIAKDNQLSKLAAQHAAQQNQIQAEQNQLALRKAKFDKEAAEAGIIMNTALAISKILAVDGANPVLTAIEIGLVTAIGAAQFAAVASTPLPQFYTGGITETPVFRAGERGNELMILPNGAGVGMTDGDGVYSAPIGTEIVNATDTSRLIEYMKGDLLFRKDGTEHRTNVMLDPRLLNKLEDIDDTIKRSGTPITNVIINTQSNDLTFKFGR